MFLIAEENDDRYKLTSALVESVALSSNCDDDDKFDDNALEDGKPFATHGKSACSHYHTALPNDEVSELSYPKFGNEGCCNGCTQAFCSSLLTSVLWYSNFFYLLRVWFPIADFMADTLTIFYLLHVGGVFLVWGYILLTIYLLSLRMQTFLFINFLLYTESSPTDIVEDVASAGNVNSNDRAIKLKKINAKDCFIMYCPLVGPFMASCNDQLTNIDYGEPESNVFGHVIWSILLEISFWILIPFVILLKLAWAFQGYFQWFNFLCCKCQKDDTYDPRNNTINSNTANSSSDTLIDIENEISMILIEGKQPIIDFSDTVEIFTENLPQLFIQIFVLSTLGLADPTGYFSLGTKLFKIIKTGTILGKIFQGILKGTISRLDGVNETTSAEQTIGSSRMTALVPKARNT